MVSATAVPETEAGAPSRQAIAGFPLSLQQERLWAFCADGDTPYRLHGVLELEGELDEDRLRGALEALLAAHEILRTTFRRLPGMETPIQVVAEEARVTWAAVDLSHLEAPLQRRHVERLLAAESRTAFEWEEAPPLRLHLIRLSPRRRLLLMGLPALCFDAFSFGPFIDRLSDEYAGGAGGEGPEPIQYIDFAEWQEEMLETPDEEAGRELWRSQRIFPLPALALPLERRLVEAGKPFRPELLSWEMDAEQARRLEAVAGELDIAAEAVLLTAWSALIWRLADASPVVVGRLSHGRGVEDLQATLGPLFKFLPVKTAPDGARSFAELAREVDRLLGSLDAHHEFYSPALLLESPEDPARESRLPFLFAYRRWPAPRAVDGLRVSLVEEHACHEPFRLKLSAVSRHASTRCSLWFDPGRISQADAEILRGQLAGLLASVLEDPEIALGGVALVDESQRRALARWNDTRTAFPEETLVGRFRARVASHPRADAVVFRQTCLSFEELDGRSNQVARFLRSLGIGPEDRVAFCLHRSAELIVVVMGILKAGAAYVPLDPWQPAERLKRIVEEVAPALVLAEGEFQDNVSLEGVRTLDLAELEEQAGRELRDDPGVRIEPESLAYVIYTSGSTGKPKGVMIEHGSLLNLSRALGAALADDLPAPSRVSINAPLAFDASVKQLLQLLDGHAVCVLPEEVRRDGAELLAYLRRHRIQVLDCTPAQLQLIMAAGLDEAEEILKRVLVGGEPLDEKSWRALARRTGTAFYNVYGPTECSVDATACRVRAEVDRPLIGRPLPNLRVHVLDPRLEPVAVGMAGQLVIAGRGVGRGYFRRPGLTAERFIPDPFAAEPGARMYQSGDRARFLASGDLELLGRIDRQVKLRGYRIELGEIEQVLRSHPAVRQSAVVLHQDTAGQGRIVAYAAPERQWSPTVEGRPRLELPGGLAVVHHQERETERLYEQCFRRPCCDGDGLPEKACVVDAGANIGLFALAVEEGWPDARVLAFEPAPPLYELLRINAELYGRQVETLAMGLGRAEGSGRFTYRPAWSLLSGPSGPAEEWIDQWAPRWRRPAASGDGDGSAGEPADAPGESLEYEAPVQTLSQVIRERGLERIDLLHIALHRGELDVLLGIAEEDWPKIDRVAVELCDPPGEVGRERLEAVEELLRRRGYRLAVRPEPELPGADLRRLHAVRDERRPGTPAAPPSPARRGGEDGELVTAAVLRRFAKEHLPEYMLPAQLMVLESLPLTPNGKINHKALPRPSEERPELEAGYEAPRNPVEEQLAEIWSRLLGVERIGIRDNFFEVGGDSILSIQVVARAHEAGIRLTPRQMFECQTIAELAVVAGQTRSIEAEQGPVAGEVELTPVQRWLLERELRGIEHWNQAVMLAGEGAVEVAALERVLAALVEHHDALRHRFEPGPPWRQSGSASAEGCLRFTWEELSGLSEEERTAAVARLAEEAQTGLDLQAGPLVRASGMAWDGEWRLLLVIHHLVVDGVSWRILLDDLQKGYRQLTSGEELDLGRKTTSFQYWAHRLARHAREEESLRQELPYWLEAGSGEVLALPRDRRGENVEESAQLAATRLDEETTRQLLTEAPKAYNTNVQEVLLTALCGALVEWSSQSRGRVLIELEGHGREELFEEVDLTRTVGWFTALYPVCLPMSLVEPAGEALKRTKEILRRVPGRGVGYGLLRYLGGEEVSRRLAELPEPEIGFNYLGRLDQVLEHEGPFRAAGESVGPSRSPEGARAHLLDFSADVSGGRLELRCIYSRNLHHPERIEGLLELTRRRLLALIDHCLAPEAGDYTPSDFPMAALDDEQLGAILDGFEFEGETES